MFEWGIIGNSGERMVFKFLGYKEIDILNNKFSLINEFLKNYGFNEVEYRLNEEKAEGIKNSIKNDFNNVSYKENNLNKSTNSDNKNSYDLILIITLFLLII